MFASTRTLPFVILHGTSDEFVNPAWSRKLYPLMLPPKFLVEIVGGDHDGFSSGLGNLRDPDVIGIFTTLPIPGGLAQTAALDAALLAKVPGADLTPCALPPMLPNPNVTLDPLIPKAEQVRITNGALTAFFDAFLRHDRGARRFFLRLSRRRTAFGREVRSCKSPRRSRPCHLPPLPSSPSGAFVDALDYSASHWRQR